MEINKITRLIEETIPQAVMKSLEEAFQEYPQRRVLMRANGRFIENIDGIPLITNNHEIVHQIVALGKGDGQASNLYLLDSQEDCRCRGNYCARDNSSIVVDYFDEKTNPEKIKEFLKDIRDPNGFYTSSHVVEKFGIGVRWKDVDLDMPGNWHKDGILRFQAFREGETEHFKEKKEEARVEVRIGEVYRVLEGIKIPYQSMKDFIHSLRISYTRK